MLTNSGTAISNLLAITVFIIVAGSCKTNKQTQAQKANLIQKTDSLLVDNDGNNYPIKVLRDGNLWMTTNLNLNIPNSYCYGNEKENCKQYGRLYTWESANKACKLLGEGWQLPVTAEWRQLAVAYAGPMEDSTLARKAAYKALLHTGNSGFNAVLGGGRAPDNQYSRLEAHGFYWTATESDSSMAWFYNFGKGSQALFQQYDGEKPRGFSVRCLKRIKTPG